MVDLRENNGGNSGVLRPFIDSIKNSYLNKNGKLFVLIGKKTFSYALMNAVTLKRNTSAILVGEPTSGNINHFGEVRGFSLPRTGIVIGYSTKYWENWKGKIGPLIPYKKVIYSINDFKKKYRSSYIYSL
ncbi:S41 family peptidase [Pedobacter sp. SL55]|uniref:S41 family peptidase n=1 Tax=Pedobacter sp. SL55 TaxID=2995161 RepID=UPI002270E333|nr:S41 family peptidase [Pedobacter sp. SL55]WAC40145.1 S41 family peptidase [Pedobacter sp. SL55]